jgi:HK97 family phage major capsid protein
VIAIPYDNVIARNEVSGFLPEDVVADLIEGATEQSAAMQLFRTIRLGGTITRMPVMQALPVAYFVNGDTGLKQTTEASWASKYLNVEEIAAILPVPENVADDLQFDIFDSLRPFLEEAVALTLDDAIFFGTGKPSSWPAAIGPGAAAAAQTVTSDTAQADGGIFEDANQVLEKIEEDGFDPKSWVFPRNFRARLRRARTTEGNQLNDFAGINALWDLPIEYALPGQWPTGSGSILGFCGDWSEAILGLRQDVQYKLLDQAVIQDNTGAIIYNLAQQDMVALRLTFRAAFQVSNRVTRDNTNEATRYPFATLVAS